MTNIKYRDILTKSSPTKSLTYGFKRSVGRNSQGRITMRHKGGGHKRLYRDIDFLFDKKFFVRKKSDFVSFTLFKNYSFRDSLPKVPSIGCHFSRRGKTTLI